MNGIKRMAYNLGHKLRLTIAFSEHIFPLVNSLNDIEKKRAAAFRLEHLREQYTFAHAFKREMLSYYYPLKKAPKWRFEHTLSGKPFINENIAFNLSHSISSVVIALVDSSDKNAIGVDMECFRDMADLESMIEIVCHPDERQHLNLCENRSKGFFTIWTAKEALLKACGSGLINDLSSINCLPSLLSDQCYLLRWQGKQYSLKSFSFDWGVITLAWSTDLSVSNIQLANWTSGAPVSEIFYI
ncbi:MAG: 4'-phosphopantetheinyl transferase superfamily protein [Oceanospirillaceae bacterium]|nr:4'-phosphopantetheinyl transferase superfamily protein [Oceanospirillaceae bacterium]